VESRAAEVLDFLIRFVDEDLLPALPPEEAEAAQTDLERIRGGLAEIEGFVKQRMQRLRAELETLRDRTLQCPDCRQWALVVEPAQAQGAARASRCRFCGMSHDAEEVALVYGVEILGRDPGMPDMLTGLTATDHCPYCEVESLVDGVRFAADPDTPLAFCFQCTRSQSALAVCPGCGHSFRPADGATSCENCTAASAPPQAP
jgi:transcription elongation factor Elf1